MTSPIFYNCFSIVASMTKGTSGTCLYKFWTVACVLYTITLACPFLLFFCFPLLCALFHPHNFLHSTFNILLFLKGCQIILLFVLGHFFPSFYPSLGAQRLLYALFLTPTLLVTPRLFVWVVKIRLYSVGPMS
jgi:hypothetical protein